MQKKNWFWKIGNFSKIFALKGYCEGPMINGKINFSSIKTRGAGGGA